MDTKRWPTLLVFAGGCLTGALLFALNARDGEATPSTRLREPPSQVFSLRPDQPTPASSRALGASPANDEPQPKTTELSPSPADSGNSVADVLTRLEAEYVQRAASDLAERQAAPASDTPARSAANTAATKESPHEAPDDGDRSREQSALSEEAAARSAKPEAPVAARGRGSASAPEQAPPQESAEARGGSQARAPAVEVALAGVASSSDIRSVSPVDTGAQQITAQIQQITLMQQATLAQQSALLQYLQLLSLTNPARATRSAWSARPRATGGRIVATLPSSISDSDNPWGFELQPSVLVH